jgi:hypothetical protein
VDFTDEADAAFARFAEAGAHVVRSTEPIEVWLERTTGVRHGSDPRSRP